MENYWKERIGDKAYDSDNLDSMLEMDHGIKMIAQHRSKRVKKKTLDGKPLRRYKMEGYMFVWLDPKFQEMGGSSRILFY